jgi:hypothetical protein
MVVECQCGMVMSLPAGGARQRCLRCGAAELKALDRFAPAELSGENFSGKRRGERQPSHCVLFVPIDLDCRELICDGAHI